MTGQPAARYDYSLTPDESEGVVVVAGREIAFLTPATVPGSPGAATWGPKHYVQLVELQQFHDLLAACLAGKEIDQAKPGAASRHFLIEMRKNLDKAIILTGDPWVAVRREDDEMVIVTTFQEWDDAVQWAKAEPAPIHIFPSTHIAFATNVAYRPDITPGRRFPVPASLQKENDHG